MSEIDNSELPDDNENVCFDCGQIWDLCGCRVNALNFIPDGYIVDARERSLHFFEIEIYNPMERAKLQAYAAFVTDMHWYDIEFGVYACNKHGHINRVDLLPHYIEWVESLGRE